LVEAKADRREASLRALRHVTHRAAFSLGLHGDLHAPVDYRGIHLLRHPPVRAPGTPHECKKVTEGTARVVVGSAQLVLILRPPDGRRVRQGAQEPSPKSHS
jgi:hypothetical protein